MKEFLQVLLAGHGHDSFGFIKLPCQPKGPILVPRRKLIDESAAERARRLEHCCEAHVE